MSKRTDAAVLHADVIEESPIPAANYHPDHWERYEPVLEAIRSAEAARMAAVQVTPLPIIRIKDEEIDAYAAKLSFARVAKPVVSILVPVYNNIRLTLECLTSLKQHTRGVTYEVIIADDASSDRSEELLSRIKGVIYVRNKQNMGFLRNCNNAAKKAKGKYLLLLNNDVQVVDGWLKAMTQTFDDYKDVGIVGPKILYPNGALQEAGGLINRDCTTSLIGLNDDPKKARYNYARDVDYCSGCCLLIKTALFKKLGGLDEAYLPAYCEDVDLCLKAQKLGLRCVYQPKAEIVHHMSATFNALSRSAKEGYVVKNQQTLSARYQPDIDEAQKLRAIAFYLPQFHPIAENDLWWGKGFTEWTNVSKTTPNFEGHYQPHLPAELGFYDLRVEEIMDQQAEMAKRYGIHGFCYFYFWFGGRRLLEMPIERMLKTNRPDFPFCLSWANENWTRRWDGQEKEVLIAQAQTPEDDEAVIIDLMRFMRHPNYIRINGKPLLLVYRINLFPDIRRTVKIWRNVCRREGLGEIYLAMEESFEQAVIMDPPEKYGFDASVEYPPHMMGSPVVPKGKMLNPKYDGFINDYEEIVKRYTSKEIPAFTRFRGVMPSWDNAPRRQDNATSFIHSSPGAYQAWLESAIEDTLKQNTGDERIIILNAWNEWAEGAHLEPDRRYGHAWLEATRNALEARFLKSKVL